MYGVSNLKGYLMCYGLNLVDTMFVIVVMYRWHDCGLSMLCVWANI